MIATLSHFGGTATSVIWPFAAGVLTFLLAAAMILAAIGFIKTLLR